MQADTVFKQNNAIDVSQLANLIERLLIEQISTVLAAPAATVSPAGK